MIHICTGGPRFWFQTRDTCPACAEETDQVGFYQVWYGDLTTCCECGAVFMWSESWICQGLNAPGWQARAEEAQQRAAELPPKWGEEHTAWLAQEMAS